MLAAKPDVVNFNGVWPDIDLFCRLLEAGINVVTTSDWIRAITATGTTPTRQAKSPPN